MPIPLTGLHTDFNEVFTFDSDGAGGRRALNDAIGPRTTDPITGDISPAA